MKVSKRYSLQHHAPISSNSSMVCYKRVQLVAGKGTSFLTETPIYR